MEKESEKEVKPLENGDAKGAFSYINEFFFFFKGKNLICKVNNFIPIYRGGSFPEEEV